MKNDEIAQLVLDLNEIKSWAAGYGEALLDTATFTVIQSAVNFNLNALQAILSSPSRLPSLLRTPEYKEIKNLTLALVEQVKSMDGSYFGSLSTS